MEIKTFIVYNAFKIDVTSFLAKSSSFIHFVHLIFFLGIIVHPVSHLQHQPIICVYRVITVRLAQNTQYLAQMELINQHLVKNHVLTVQKVFTVIPPKVRWSILNRVRKVIIVRWEHHTKRHSLV